MKPRMASSGVSWLGDIPESWSVQKFRYLFRESPEKIESVVVGPMLSVSGYRGIEVKEYDDENRRRLDEDLIGYRIVRPGQLVVNTMWMNYAGLGVSPFEGHVSPAYRSYSFLTDLDRGYAHYLLRSSTYVKGYTRLLTGIRPNSLQMSREDLMDFPVLLPPPHEQAAIAAFLDDETLKIDALVKEQRRLIELLKEKRQAIISNAVTKGLDPRAEMKPSGVEWLGDVPKHWMVAAVKRAAGIFIPQRNKPELNTEGIGLPWVTMETMASSEVVDANVYVSEEAALAAGSRVLPPNSVIASCVGTFGISSINRREVIINQQLQAYLPGPAILPEFLRYLVISGRSHFERVGKAATLVYVNQDGFAEFPIVVPSIPEQAQIVTALASKLSALDALAAEVTRGVLLLEERRAALVSAVVIGKIAVPGASVMEGA